MPQPVATKHPDKRAMPKLSTVGQSGHTSDFEQDLTAAKGENGSRRGRKDA
jgi:hypothetical protein